MYVWFRLGPDPSGPSQGSRDWVGLSLIPKLFFYFCAVQGKLGLSLGSTRSIQMVYTSYPSCTPTIVLFIPLPLHLLHQHSQTGIC